jgi:hypothetical protein
MKGSDITEVAGAYGRNQTGIKPHCIGSPETSLTRRVLTLVSMRDSILQSELEVTAGCGVHTGIRATATRGIVEQYGDSIRLC